MVGRATLTMVVSMMDMNMAATKTTLTATFSLTNPVVRGLPDRGRPATSAGAFMVQASPVRHRARITASARHHPMLPAIPA